MTTHVIKDYSILMTRQLLICFFVSLFFLQKIVAATDPNQVLTIPSDEVQQKENVQNDSSSEIIQDQGLVKTPPNSKIDSHSDSFHLKPSPSFTLAMSPAYHVREEEIDHWFGLHLSPWMGPTHRIQLGVDTYNRFGWLQAAYHVLPTRTRSRWFWGGGLSALVDTREDLRPLLKFKNYFAFATGGLDYQWMPQHSLRLEASYHQSTDFAFVRGTIGFTTYF